MDWALINLVDCPTQDCWITADNNDGSLAWLGHANQSNFHYNGNSTFTTLYANHKQVSDSYLVKMVLIQ